MNIELKISYGYYLVFETTNVKVEEDIEVRTYPLKPDGKPDFLAPPKRDINDSVMTQITNLLSDLIYYREKEFDSSELIRYLFDKLPEIVRKELLNKLIKNYKE
jgi:hypothetical protein